MCWRKKVTTKKKLKIGLLFLTLSFLIIFYFKDDFLFSSFSYNNRFLSKVFLKLGANIDGKDSYGYPLIHYAVISKNKENVDFLIRRNANLNVKDKNGTTPLKMAIIVGNLDIVKLLVENGAKMNEDSSNRLPILTATLKDQVEIVKYLFKYSEMASLDKVTLIGHVFYNSNLELLKFFNKNGVEITFKPLTSLVHQKTNEKKAIEMLKFLIAKGANLNEKRCMQRTLLMSSAIWHKNEVLDFLLKNGVNKNIKDDEGKTALDWARLNRNEKGALILEKFQVE